MTPARFVLCLALTGAGTGLLSAQSDLDAFMQQVLARRDDNWQKLQQYILDERETVELRGPARVSLWGQRSDYTWYVRDGFFVRSPLKINGATVGEADRRKYEADFLRREQRREQTPQNRAAGSAPAPSAPGPDEAPHDLDGLIKQTQQPQFITSAYFLRFKFDAGRYALVGHETLEERDVLRIEYYPTRLFSGETRRAGANDSDTARRRGKNEDAAYENQMMRLMNKKSKVTLWIEPTSHQILKYTFDDLGWDFFPGQWLVRMSDVTASMTVGQPFPGVWLPRGLVMDVGMMLAIGPIDLHYALDYHDYRRPDVSSKVGIPGGR